MALSFVLQVYGRPDIYAQAHYCLHSLYHQLGDAWAQWPIRLYTDQPEALARQYAAWPHIQPVALSPGQLADWAGPQQFVHRVKLEVLRHAAREGHALFYLDTDTFFVQDPRPALAAIEQEGVFYQHEYEYSLARPNGILPRKVARFARRNRFTLVGAPLQIGPDTEMWNAGVIGLPPGRADLLGWMLALTDVLYAAYPKHVMEQLAVSYVLQQAGPRRPAAPFLYHYWQHKPGVMAHIGPYLAGHGSFAARAELYSAQQADLQSWLAAQADPARPRPGWRRLIGL